MSDSPDLLENCNHYTPARRNSTKTTVRYFIRDCPYCVIEKQQSQLRLLAEAVLEAHFDYGGCDENCTFATGNGCTADTDKVECSNICQCPACVLAREIMEVSATVRVD